MARWAPDTPERLQQAALDLFATRGFEHTTAAEIAEAAGLTQRTFFRYFADKRDVLFHGQDRFVGVFVRGITDAPPGASAMELVAAALTSAASWFPAERRAYSRIRQAVIEDNPALQERERHKLAGLARTVAEALRERGIPEPAATLAAESGATVFALAFGQWIARGEKRPLAVVADELLAELRALHI